MPFSWSNAKLKAREKFQYRCEKLATSNPDFKLAHPELVKELLNKSIQNKVETKKYCQKVMDRKQKYASMPPPSVVIKRYNRVK